MSHLVIKEFTHGKNKVAKVGEQVEMKKASSLVVNRLITKGYIAPDAATSVAPRVVRVGGEEAKKNFEEAKSKKDAKKNGKAKVQANADSDESTKEKKSGKKKSDE